MADYHTLHHLHPLLLIFFHSASQIPGNVLQGILGNQATRQPLHQPFLHDAGLRNARAAVVRRHRLHSEDPGPGQVGAGGPGLLHEADERRSPRRLDYQNGLDLPHYPPARHELKWQPEGLSEGLWQQLHTTNQKRNEK